ncbi:MAG: glycosyltransferase family 4 protein [Thermoplasmatales archaeon E-plasma]|nr:MAG: glycosyltransferase family 4 protein [Thermoplasmatales archaeon E-plasma]
MKEKVNKVFSDFVGIFKRNCIYDFTFVLPEFNFVPPGGYLVVFELSEYLSKKGYKVSIVFLKNIESGLYKITKNIILKNHKVPTTIKYTIFRNILGKFLIALIINLIKKYPSFSNLLLKIGINLRQEFFKEFDFDCLDFTISKQIPKGLRTKRLIATAWQTTYFVNRFGGCNLKYYLVQNSEDDYSFSGSLSELARESYDFSPKKIVINQRMMDRFSRESPIKITVAPHIQGKIKCKPEGRDNNIILFQLRNGVDKGANVAIEAARLIHLEKPNIEIISYGSYKGDLPSFIHHYGYVSDTLYVELFNMASIFILPSLVEGFPTPILEAMACGCVPVSTKSGGTEEMIDQMINGILVPIDDPQSICEKVVWLVNNVEKRIDMAYKAISTLNNYSIERMGIEFVEGITKYENEGKETFSKNIT